MKILSNYNRTKKYRLSPVNMEKRLARRKVEYRVKIGKMKKKPCLFCGKRKVEAHHENYSKPLEVVWLCKRHHIQVDYYGLSLSTGKHLQRTAR